MNTKPKARVAIVTGGSRGIGAAIAEKLAIDGLTVHITYRDAADAAKQVAARIAEDGGQIRIHRSDVAVERDVADLVDDVVAEGGGVHVLVNNAAIIDDKLLALTKTSHWEKILRVNLTGPFLTSRAVLPTMLAQEWGRSSTSRPTRPGFPGQGRRRTRRPRVVSRR